MMDEMIRSLRSAPRVPGYERMYVHGEREFEVEAERRKNGIPLHQAVVDSLRPLSTEFGVPFPAPLS